MELSAEYKMKLAKILNWNRGNNVDIEKLFLDEYKEFEEELRKYKEIIKEYETMDKIIFIKERSNLLSKVYSELADCFITFRQLNKKQVNNNFLSVRIINYNIRLYGNDELLSYINLKIDRTLRRKNEGYYDDVIKKSIEEETSSQVPTHKHTTKIKKATVKVNALSRSSVLIEDELGNVVRICEEEGVSVLRFFDEENVINSLVMSLDSDKRIKRANDILRFLGTNFEVVKEEPRWRADKDNPYFVVNAIGHVMTQIDTGTETDTELWEKHNYFKTEKEAENKAKLIKEIFLK